MPLPTSSGTQSADIDGHRPFLLRYARARVRDAHQAEEAVQEALLSALEGIAGFRGQSSLRTWLISILRFKLVDLERRAIDDGRVESLAETRDSESALADDGWEEDGHWRAMPQSWSDPEAAFEQRRFWETFERCLDRLPPASARVFFRREVAGDETKEICRTEGITESNCWVILHRSRLALRQCLEANWFGNGAPHGRE